MQSRYDKQHYFIEGTIAIGEKVFGIIADRSEQGRVYRVGQVYEDNYAVTLYHSGDHYFTSEDAHRQLHKLSHIHGATCSHGKKCPFWDRWTPEAKRQIQELDEFIQANG